MTAAGSRAQFRSDPGGGYRAPVIGRPAAQDTLESGLPGPWIDLERAEFKKMSAHLSATGDI